jgi:choline dehydrogenase-like flavoprotein
VGTPFLGSSVVGSKIGDWREAMSNGASGEAARNYDYVIVGAGSAGCVVARRLLDGTDATVLLLEAPFWKSRSALARPDLMSLPPQFPFVSSEIGDQYGPPPNTFSIVPALVRPRSRGYLRMKTAEPSGPLEIQPNFLSEQADVDALVAGIELGLALAAQPALRDLIKRWVVPPRRLSRKDTVAFLRRSCSSYFHPVGTCAMGSGQEAVVDAELRVRGVEGLRIADASVMPTIPSDNTQAPAVMIGEFASRLLVPGRVAAPECVLSVKDLSIHSDTRQPTPLFDRHNDNSRSEDEYVATWRL